MKCWYVGQAGGEAGYAGTITLGSRLAGLGKLGAGTGRKETG